LEANGWDTTQMGLHGETDSFDSEKKDPVVVETNEV
jgi:hypothetical protein